MGRDLLTMRADLSSFPEPSELAKDVVARRMRMVVMEHRYAELRPDLPSVDRDGVVFSFSVADEARGVRDLADAAELAERLRLIVADEQRRWIEDIYPLDIGFADWNLYGPRFA